MLKNTTAIPPKLCPLQCHITNRGNHIAIWWIAKPWPSQRKWHNVHSLLNECKVWPILAHQVLVWSPIHRKCCWIHRKCCWAFLNQLVQQPLHKCSLLNWLQGSWPEVTLLIFRIRAEIIYIHASLYVSGKVIHVLTCQRLSQKAWDWINSIFSG